MSNILKHRITADDGVTINSGTFGAAQGEGGPFRSSAGNFYVLLKSATSAVIRFLKYADDGTGAERTANWSAIAFAQGIAAFQVGDTIHVWANSNNGTNTILRKNTFNMATDTWGTADVISGASSAGGEDGMTGVLRSDGDELIAYNGDSEKVMGTEYERVYWQRDEGAGYGTETLLPNQSGAATSYKNPSSVMGASDLWHVFWLAASAVYHVSISSSNSVSARDTLPGGVASSPTLFTPVYYDDGGVERITVARMADTPDRPESIEIDNDGTPGTEEEVFQFTPTKSSGNRPIAFAMAADADTKTVWAVAFSSTQKLQIDKNVDSAGWGTDTQILDPTQGPQQTTGGTALPIGAATANEKRAQRVDPTNTTAQHLIELQLQLSKTGTPTDALVIELWEGGATPETGTLVGTFSFQAANVGTSLAVRSARFAGFPYTNANDYYIVLSRSGAIDASNYYNVGTTNTSAYAGGGMWTYTGSGWGAESSTIDFYFSWGFTRNYYNAAARVHDHSDGSSSLVFALDDAPNDTVIVFDYEIVPAPAKAFPRRQLTTVRM